jgi:hypothetical protein
MNSSDETIIDKDAYGINSNVGIGFLALHKETYKVIKNNLVSAMKFTAPFIFVCFLWSSFIGDRYANQIESIILAGVITLTIASTCIHVFRNEFLKEYHQSFFDLFSDKAFLLVFFYWLFPKLIGSIGDFINEVSRIQGFEEFYALLISLLSLYFWFRYLNFIYYASLFKVATSELVVRDQRGFYFKNALNIFLFLAYVGLVFAGLMFLFHDKSIFPSYMSKPFFILFIWIIGLVLGLVVTSSLVVINKAKVI